MLIDATHAEETRVVVVDGNKVEEFDFETVNKRQLAGNIYLAKVTRVEPSLQAAFVDYGGNRHGFLAFAEIHPDYYQIPVADRKALIEEERAAGPRRGRGGEPPLAPPPPKPRPRPKPRRCRPGGDRAPPAWRSSIWATRPPAAIERPRRTTEAARRRCRDGADDHRTMTPTATTRPIAPSTTPATPMTRSNRSPKRTWPRRSPARRPRARRYKIQEVVKVRQIMLVQVVKEERGNKGAALTTYLSLAGRYCVLMPNTARGGGISRKITKAADRKKLKEIAGEMEVPEGAGLIIRTAGAKRTKAGDQARLRIPDAAVGTDPRADAEIHRARQDLRGRRPDQAHDPRPLLARDRRGAGRRRGRLSHRQGLHAHDHAQPRQAGAALYRHRRRFSPAIRSRAIWPACSTRSCS
jgi:ribonuclease E